MSVYVGIDVHRKRSQVAVIDADGEVAGEPECAERGPDDPAAKRQDGQAASSNPLRIVHADDVHRYAGTITRQAEKPTGHHS